MTKKKAPPPPPPEDSLPTEVAPPKPPPRARSRAKARRETLIPPIPTLTKLPEVADDPFGDDLLDPPPISVARSKPRRLKIVPKAPWSMSIARNELEAIMEICRKTGSYEPMREQAAARHFVALYAYCFEKVYGSPPPTMTPQERVGAASNVSHRLKNDFRGDAAEMARYFAFIWDREAATMKANGGMTRRMITWDLMMVRPNLFYDWGQHVLKQRAQSRPSALFSQPAPAGA